MPLPLLGLQQRPLHQHDLALSKLSTDSLSKKAAALGSCSCDQGREHRDHRLAEKLAGQSSGSGLRLRSLFSMLMLCTRTQLAILLCSRTPTCCCKAETQSQLLPESCLDASRHSCIGTVVPASPLVTEPCETCNSQMTSP